MVGDQDWWADLLALTLRHGSPVGTFLSVVVAQYQSGALDNPAGAYSEPDVVLFDRIFRPLIYTAR